MANVSEMQRALSGWVHSICCNSEDVTPLVHALIDEVRSAQETANTAAIKRAFEAVEEYERLRKRPDPQAEWLAKLEAAAKQLLEVIALERTGKRDGDGFWFGSDPLDGTLWTLDRLRQSRPRHHNDEGELAVPF